MEQRVFISLTIEEYKELLTAAVKEAVKAEMNSIHVDVSADKKQFFTRAETAAKLGISLPTLRAWSITGLITSHHIGTRVRYRAEDIDAALKKQGRSK